MKPAFFVLTLLLSLGIATAAQAQARSGGSPAPSTTAKPTPPTPTATPSTPPKPTPATPTAAVSPTIAGVVLPADYVIGPEDILTIVFWREKDLSSDVVVRPDGRISLPVIQDIAAAGLTPEQLRANLTTQAERYVEDPNVTVVVKEIKSRKVFITGQVARPGPYLLTAPVNVVQLIALAGGLLEYADAKNIVVMRTENGAPTSFRFNYKEVAERKNLKQNISLKPGDTVLVP